MDIKVGVLRGGNSLNRDFSLRGGSHLITLIDRTKFKPFDIVVSPDNKWLIEGKEVDPHKYLDKLDVIFNTLLDHSHGNLIESFNIPHTGSSRLASAIAQNKLLTKEVLNTHKVSVKFPKHIELISKELSSSKIIELNASDIIKKISFPIIIKPSHGGTSLGITYAQSFHELTDGIALAMQLAASVIIEEFIKGKEVSMTVIDNFRGEPLYVSLPVHIMPAAGDQHLHIHSKFNQTYKTDSPGKFSEKEKMELSEIAKEIHTSLGLKHISISDFILHPKKGLYFIETNTVPLFHKDGVVYEGIKAAGGSERELINHLITDALLGSHHLV